MSKSKGGRPKKDSEKKTIQTISIRLSEQDIVALKKICAVTGLNKTEFVRECIKDRIYDLEYERTYYNYSDLYGDDD